MSDQYTCLEGHRWQALPTAAAICPVCGNPPLAPADRPHWATYETIELPPASLDAADSLPSPNGHPARSDDRPTIPPPEIVCAASAGGLPLLPGYELLEPLSAGAF